MLIDDVTIRVEGGRGGDGVVAFNRTKMNLGPTGANGGLGGAVYFVGVSDLGALQQFQFKKEVKAENGGTGTKKLRDGAAGKDLELKVPIGTVIHDIDTGTSREITKVGERVLAAKGGAGGIGNFLHRSATNTSPMEATAGREAKVHHYRLELKMIADVGFIGLPNTGKSSLLNVLTNAAAKVGNYAFTTLEPNLGAHYSLILADIPGLIEGASGGKGLGTKFLRHIERTKTLFHLVSAESDDVARDYAIVRSELAAYSAELTKKPEHVFLSKSDTVSAEEAATKIAALKRVGADAHRFSVHDGNTLTAVKKILAKVADEKTV